MTDPDEKPELHINLSGFDLDFKLGEFVEGAGVTDECINCHEQIVSTGVGIIYHKSEIYGGASSETIPSKSYNWVHAATRISKCATGPNYAASTKMP